MLEQAVFTGIQIQPKDKSREMIQEWNPDKSKNLSDYVVSADIGAVKPFDQNKE
jgi:hypothetical protein